MPFSLTRLRSRAAAKADAVAAGSTPPAGEDTEATGRASGPTARDRASMRRRLRQVERRRDALLLELGALVFELYRRGRPDGELTHRRAAEIGRLESEAEALAEALGQDRTLLEVGHGQLAPCGSCRTLVSADDRFCSHCGVALRDLPARPQGEVDPTPERAAVEG